MDAESWTSRMTAANFQALLNTDQYFFLDDLKGVVLDILASAGIIRSHHFWLDMEPIKEALQNALIYLEMVVFSVMQRYAYHVHPYTREVREFLRKVTKVKLPLESKIAPSSNNNISEKEERFPNSTFCFETNSYSGKLLKPIIVYILIG